MYCRERSLKSPADCNAFSCKVYTSQYVDSNNKLLEIRQPLMQLFVS